MKYTFATLSMLGLLGSMIAPAHAANTAVESALAGQGDYSMFYQALMTTGVANELNESTDYTIFVPTNAAFAEIQPRVYPCFYAVQCRVQVAAILRNHIVPRQESIQEFSKWGGNPIPTIGNKGLYVEETYKNDFAVNGHHVLYEDNGERVNLFRIDGVIASPQELEQFRVQPMASLPGVVTQKTVTTYHTQAAVPTEAYGVPGGASAAAPVIYMTHDPLPLDTTQTTTVTHITTEDQ